MNKDETLALWQNGESAWNAWAKAMLARRAQMEAVDQWASKEGPGWTLGRNAVTKTWLDEAKADFTGHVFEESALFGDFQFPGEASFDEVRFDSHAIFGDATFSGPTSFKGVTFRGPVLFNRAMFSRGAKFQGARFSTASMFIEVTFNEVADFSDANFNDAVSFDRALFNGMAYFNKTKFENISSFVSVRCKNNISFSGGSFTQKTSFRSVTFCATSLFERTSFGEFAEFSGATFSGTSSFAFAKLRGGAAFASVQFYSAVTCQYGTFSEAVTFQDSSFGGLADFTCVRFEGNVTFQDAEFTRHAMFRDVTFDQSAVFVGVRFAARATFHRGKFSGEANFSQASFGGHTNFNSTMFLGKAGFAGAQGRHGFVLLSADFHEVPDFIQANFEEAPRLDNVRIKMRERDANFSARYRALRRLASQGHDYIREQEYLAGELKALRGYTDKPWPNLRRWSRDGIEGNAARYWFGLLYQILSDFGRSMTRPLFWWALSTTVFAWAYMAIHFAQAAEVGKGYCFGVLVWLLDLVPWPGRAFASAPVPLSTTCIAGPGEPWSAALGLSIRKALPFVGVGSTEKLNQIYACLYGIYSSAEPGEGLPGHLTPVIPDAVDYLGIAQLLLSLLLMFLFFMALRSHFRIR